MDQFDLLEALPIAVYTTDAQGRLTFYNQAAADLWGCRPDLGVSQWCGSWRLYWPDGRPLPHDECPMAVALKEGRLVRGVEAIAERPDGTRIPFLPYPTPLKDASGRVVGAVNLLMDLSDRDHKELELARLAAIVVSSDDAIISKNLEGRILTWNAGATRIFGYEAEEMIGEPITRIIPPELHDEEKEILARLRKGETIHHYETIRVAKNGRRVDISLTVSPLRDRFGRVVGASKVGRDITERKQAERLQHLLIEELNHRVKNTLATVQAIAAQSLRRSKSPADFVSAFTGRVQALAKAHTVLTQSGMRGGGLMEVIREQVLLGPAEDPRVSCSGPLVMLDAQQALHLALVLHELATNARKYGALSVPGGRLAVTWEMHTGDGRSLLLSWRESGGPRVSAPSEHGFGTTLIEQTLRSHGGEASIYYAAEGVSCEIRLPLPNEPRLDVAAYAAARSAGVLRSVVNRPDPEPVFKGKRILLIEDEPIISMEMEMTLATAGCEIVGPAGSLEQAKSLVAKAHFHAALLDANLAGQRVDELAKTLTQRNIPFAFVTGYGRERLPEGFHDAVLLEKPFSEGQLLSMVELLLRPGTGVFPLRQQKT